MPKNNRIANNWNCSGAEGIALTHSYFTRSLVTMD